MGKAWHEAVLGLTKRWIRLSDRTTERYLNGWSHSEKRKSGRNHSVLLKDGLLAYVHVGLRPYGHTQMCGETV